MSQIGRVIKSTGSWYAVKTESGELWTCRLAGKIKLEGLKLTNPIAVGDLVEFDAEQGTPYQGFIRQILPRKNYVVRQSPRKKHLLHFLASNIDGVLLITTIRETELKFGFIDRFLMNNLNEIYSRIGYTTLPVSAKTREGLSTIKDILKDKNTLISGQSGVGKTSLINSIDPTLQLKTDLLSQYSGKGQHTTTFAELYDIPNIGTIIDTPGIKTLSFSHLEVQDIVHNFKEIFLHSQGCKYTNCTHRNEPRCAVKEALEAHVIDFSRYISYLNILEEIEDQNYWERHKDV